MLNKHPGAQLLKFSGDPPPEIRFGTDQYIQCASVTPEPDRSHTVFTNPDVPPQIKSYYEHKYADPTIASLIYTNLFTAVSTYSAPHARCRG
jgi:hypothetical protein